MPALVEYGVGLLPYFPLASGLLTGKYRRGEPAPEGSRIAAWNMQSQLTDRAFDRVEALDALARRYDATLLDVAVGGLASRPTVASVIAGATSAEQVRSNVRAGTWRPSAKAAQELAEILSPPSS